MYWTVDGEKRWYVTIDRKRKRGKSAVTWRHWRKAIRDAKRNTPFERYTHRGKTRGRGGLMGGGFPRLFGVARLIFRLIRRWIEVEDRKIGWFFCENSVKSGKLPQGAAADVNSGRSGPAPLQQAKNLHTPSQPATTPNLNTIFASQKNFTSK